MDTISEKYRMRNVCKTEENPEFFIGLYKIISSNNILLGEIEIYRIGRDLTVGR